MQNFSDTEHFCADVYVRAYNLIGHSTTFVFLFTRDSS